MINRLLQSFSKDLHGSLARFSMADHSSYLKVTPDVVQSARYDSDIYPAQFVAGRQFRPLGDFPPDQIHGAFQPGDSLFEVTQIIGNLINSDKDMAEMLKYEIFSLFSHAIGSNFVVQGLRRTTASRPPFSWVEGTP